MRENCAVKAREVAVRRLVQSANEARDDAEEWERRKEELAETRRRAVQRRHDLQTGRAQPFLTLRVPLGELMRLLPACPKCGAPEGGPCRHAGYGTVVALAHDERFPGLVERVELFIAAELMGERVPDLSLASERRELRARLRDERRGRRSL